MTTRKLMISYKTFVKEFMKQISKDGTNSMYTYEVLIKLMN